MHIERSHNVGRAEATRRIDALLDDLLRRPFPGGITVQETSRNWSDNILNFSVKAKRGFLGTTISGVLGVNDGSVVLDCELPGLVTTFINEDKIREMVLQQLAGLFPA